MWYAWSRILRRKPAVSIPSQRGSSRNLFSSWLHSSPAFLTGRYCRASSRRISASPRWRQSSKSPPLIRPCSAVTGPSRTCRSYRRCSNGLSTSGCFFIFISNGLLPEHQSAYRRSHSTETALLKVTSDALIAADMGKLTLLGMLDLRAAFDCMDHSILLGRLEVSFGFGGAVLDWMRSYLVGRRQYVRYNGLTSSTTVVQFGVPQGSVLGPLFFILYTADVFHIAEELGFYIHGYADDLQLYDHCLACDTAQLSVRLAQCIEVMGQWMSSNRLKLNASKTEFIWLGSTRRLARCTFDPIIISGVPIQPSSTVRDLGAYIDSGMSYTDHVTRLTRTCFFHIRQLRSIRRSLTVDSSHTLVRALILTRLDYCNGLLGGAPKCLLSPLTRVLRAAARLILLLPRTSSVENEIRTVLHWLDVPARITFKLCLLAHRCLHASAPPYLIRPVLHTGQLYRRTLTSPFGRHGHGVCA